MTLVLTEISEFGIAMATDSALTHTFKFEGEQKKRVYHGAVKLLRISSLQAGLSVWGLASFDYIPVEYYLKKFLKNNEGKFNSLKDLAMLLENDLRALFPSIDISKHPSGTFGIHLAGFEDVKGEKLPSFWHIHNGFSQHYSGIDPTKINANNDRPPAKILPGRFFRTRNGSIENYVKIFGSLEIFFNQLRADGFVIPDYSTLDVTPLQARAEYLRFHIRTMSDIYKLSNVPIPGSIGGAVVTLTISKDGIQNYEKR